MSKKILAPRISSRIGQIYETMQVTHFFDELVAVHAEHEYVRERVQQVSDGGQCEHAYSSDL